MKKKQRLAVIDIGSLKTVMKIFSISADAPPEEIESIRSYLPLGTYTYRNGVISSEDIQAVSDILLRFLETIRAYKVQKVLCVATSAFREAENKFFAVEQIRLRTGFSIEILDNSMERFYRNLLVKETTEDFLKLIADGTFMLDIGAGSIQSSVFNSESFIFSQNMSLGPLRISDLYAGFSHSVSDPQVVLEEYISRVLEDYHAIAPKDVQYKTLIAFGEETAYLKLLLDMDPQGTVSLSTEKFFAFFQRLEKISVSSLILDYHIPSPAAGLIQPSALLIKKTLEYGRFTKILLPEISLPDGLSFYYANKYHHFPLQFDYREDILTAARNIGKRYRYDKKHAERVRVFSAEIFSSLLRLHGLSEKEKLLLETAAILYEVGKHIHISDYLLRSYRIIDTTEIVGLSEKELSVVSNTIRYCASTSVFRAHSFQELPEDVMSIVSKLSAILSLADALEVSRKQKIVRLKVNAAQGAFSFLCDCQSDASYEVWEFDKRKTLFLEVFGVAPELKIRRVSK